MFKYNEFPILSKQLYSSKGVFCHKKFRFKSAKPFFKNSSYSLINVIDVENSQHFTLKQIFKVKSLSKDLTLAEISNQSAMNKNENFIEVKQIYEDHECIYILMEENKINLQEILAQRMQLLEREVQYIFCQLVFILESLRKNNIFHGNITLANLFIDPSTMKIKLSGFNHSINISKIKENNHVNLLSGIETTSYTSPELLQANIQNPQTYYFSDIWSVGVILYELLTGEQPFLAIDKRKNTGTVSISKIKNFSFQFPQPTANIPFFTEKAINDGFQQLATHAIFTTQQDSFKHSPSFTQSQAVSTVWKELIKKIFVSKQRRITLCQLIRHPLNDIIESKFIELNLKDPPTISNHYIVRDEQKVKQLKKQNEFTLNRKRNSRKNKQKILLTGGQVSTSILKIVLQQQNPKIKIPLIVSQPEYFQQYCYIQESKCLGYLFRNSIGVVFGDGSLVIGQNGKNYLYINNDSNDSAESICMEYYLLDQEYCSRTQQSGKSGNERSEGFTLPNSNNNMIGFKKHEKMAVAAFQALPPAKLQIFQYFLAYFGDRVIADELSIWMLNYWRIQSADIFLFSNGVWQVNLDQEITYRRKKNFNHENKSPSQKLHITHYSEEPIQTRKRGQGAVLIDKNNLGWWLPPNESKFQRNAYSHSSVCIKIGRRLVGKIKAQYFQQFCELIEPYKYSQKS